MAKKKQQFNKIKYVYPVPNIELVLCSSMAEYIEIFDTLREYRYTWSGHNLVCDEAENAVNYALYKVEQNSVYITVYIADEKLAHLKGSEMISMVCSIVDYWRQTLAFPVTSTVVEIARTYIADVFDEWKTDAQEKIESKKKEERRVQRQKKAAAAAKAAAKAAKQSQGDKQATDDQKRTAAEKAPSIDEEVQVTMSDEKLVDIAETASEIIGAAVADAIDSKAAHLEVASPKTSQGESLMEVFNSDDQFLQEHFSVVNVD